MYKVYSDSYLKSMTKDEIICLLRCAEHNWTVEKERTEILSFEYEHFTDGLVNDGIMDILDVNRRMLKAQMDYEAIEANKKNQLK